MKGELLTFTAAQIAAVLRISRQTVAEQLRPIQTPHTQTVSGNAAAAWTVDQFPLRLRERLAAEAARQGCRTIAALLNTPRQQWQPRDKKTNVVIPLAKISDKDLQRAAKSRLAFKPFLTRPRDASQSAEQWKALGVDLYYRIFGERISPRQWDKLYRRFEDRDNGVGDYDAIQLYLLDRWKLKVNPADVVLEALATDFTGLENLILKFQNPHAPNTSERKSLWTLAIAKYKSLVNAGERPKAAARSIRQFIFDRQVFPLVSRDGLLKTFARKLAAVEAAAGDITAAGDGRVANGRRVQIPESDVERLRWAASHNNAGEIDPSWREEYKNLSETTRQHYPATFEAPRKIHQALKRERVNALAARHKGKRALRKLCGTVERDWSQIPSMHSWVADDLTADIEVVLTERDGSIVRNHDGTPYLFTPQVIAFMDSASRKFVGWTPSTAKAPNAGIVADAAVESIKLHGVPEEIGLENGFVFGKSLLVNGKQDEQGRALVLGLGQFGCSIRHFEKMNPTSKSELEYGFRQVQKLMVRYPGYTGSSQRTSDLEEMKLQQRMIQAGKIEATKCRMTFNEFIGVLTNLILQYNATPQHGRLKGLSPDQAFLAGLNPSHPPTKFTPKLQWLVNNEREIVTVKPSGVQFTHRSSGQKITVRGGPLAHLIGEELWALTDRRDASMVTFMSLDHSNPFTLEACRKPSARQFAFAPGSEELARQRAKIREHQRAISEEYYRQQGQFGNPRRDLLAELRNQAQPDPQADSVPAQRTTVIPRKMAEAAEQMGEQRAEIRAAQEQKTRRTSANKSKAGRLGVPSIMVEADEQTARGLELLGAGGRIESDETLTTGENEA